MKKIILILSALVLACVVLISCGTQTEQSDTGADTSTDTSADTSSGDTQKEQTISSIYNYNTTSEIDSHANEWQNSHIELSFRDRMFLDQSVTTQTEVWYPRIKKMANGEYLLLYMNGETGNHIYMSRSKDLKKWTGTQRLFEGSSATETSPLYASADALVLQNGEILAVAGFRGYKSYHGDSKTNGIRIRRSTDNGVTWSEPEVIYTGGVWEPSLLQLKSGEIQLFWTNTHVGGAPAEFGGRKDDNSTGTAMLRSFDNGYTWNNNIEVPYTAQVVAQQYTKTGSDGKYYSGQMPVAWQLNNGKIVLALEVRYGTKKEGNRTYNLSMAYTDGANSWPVSLGAEEEGPSTLIKNMYLKAAGPYIRQFESGESLLSYHWATKWYTLVGNADANQFGERMAAFGPDVATSIWGSSEIIGSHTVICTVPTQVSDAKGVANGIYLGKFNLNHTIASKTNTVTVDGYLDEWTDVTDAFFVGSDSQAQAAIRVCEDSEYVYFAAEVLDYYLNSFDKVAFLIGNSSTGKYLNVAISTEGKITINKGGIKVEKADVQAAVYLGGTLGENKNRDQGYIIEMRLPKSVFADSTLIFSPVLYNKDNDTSSAQGDYVGGIDVSNTSNWLKINLASK